MPLDETTHKTMPDIVITKTGVEKILEKLDPSKAAGPDGITTRLLRTLSKEAAPIFN